MCRIKTKAWATDANSATNLRNYKKWLNATESELKSTRASFSDAGVVLTPVLNVGKKITTTRWTFKVKYDRSFKARQVVLGWRQNHGIDCGITFGY